MPAPAGVVVGPGDLGPVEPTGRRHRVGVQAGIGDGEAVGVRRALIGGRVTGQDDARLDVVDRHGLGVGVRRPIAVADGHRHC